MPNLVGAADRNPLVTVIMPFLNAERFMEEAIHSVLSQTLSEFELLLIDDGSSDASSQLARDYAARYPQRIRYLEHPGHQNRGKSVSRNLGVAQARAPYLTFLDADDVFLPDKLQHQVKLLAGQPQTVMVYGVAEYWTSWEERHERQKPDRLARLGATPGRVYFPPHLVTAYLRDPGIVPCICSLLARTAVAQQSGAFEEGIQDLFEDQIFIVKMLMAGAVYVDRHCGERYRQHRWSSSALAISKGEYHPIRNNPARLSYLKWLQDYLSKTGDISGDLERTLNVALRPYRYPNLYRVIDPINVALRWLRIRWWLNLFCRSRSRI